MNKNTIKNTKVSAPSEAVRELVLWGRKPGQPWVKLSINTSNAEMARRQRDGWEVLRQPKGSHPDSSPKPTQQLKADAPAEVRKQMYCQNKELYESIHGEGSYCPELQEAEKGVKEICDELEDCQKLTGEDMSIRVHSATPAIQPQPAKAALPPFKAVRELQDDLKRVKGQLAEATEAFNALHGDWNKSQAELERVKAQDIQVRNNRGNWIIATELNRADGFVEVRLNNGSNDIYPEEETRSYKDEIPCEDCDVLRAANHEVIEELEIVRAELERVRGQLADFEKLYHETLLDRDSLARSNDGLLEALKHLVLYGNRFAKPKHVNFCLGMDTARAAIAAVESEESK